MKTISPNQAKTAAICGLFCEGCGLYIASQEDKQKLAKIAQRYQMSPEEVRCEGCRSQKLGPYCKTCKMKTCAIDKKVNFCSECKDYPCQLVKEFQSDPKVSHRLEVSESLDRIKSSGYNTWYEEMCNYYACARCSTINSAYDISCRKCGNTPGNGYIQKHLEIISKMKVPPLIK